MARPLTVVVSDESILPEICGANDGNLRVIEELLGVRVFSRGNEIILDSDDEALGRSFTLLLRQLEDHIRLGQLPGPDLIRSIHGSLAGGDTDRVEFLKRTVVAIPNGFRTVYPRTYNQASYLQSIEKSELSFGVGPAGTGKTYLAVAQALRQVLTQVRRKLIITRPVVEAGESLGYLPGDLEQKIHPYLRPLYDAIESPRSPTCAGGPSRAPSSSSTRPRTRPASR
jgi:phosphate starvation-inducible PhoH-like protein